MKNRILLGAVLLSLMSCDDAKLSAKDKELGITGLLSQSKESGEPEFITEVSVDREVLGAKIIIENIINEYGGTTITYMYDEYGNLLSKKSPIVEDGSFDGVYDDKDRLIAESSHVDMRLHEYDNENRKIRTIIFSDYGDRLETYQYSYDKNRNILTVIREEKEIIDESFYDEKWYQELIDAISKNNRDKVKSFSIDEIIKKGNIRFGNSNIEKERYYYNDKKQLIKSRSGEDWELDFGDQEFVSDEDFAIERDGTYHYDNKGRLEKVCERPGNIITCMNYRYNEYGDLIEKRDRFYEITYTYKYNDRGDWVERIEYGYDDNKTITKRKIQYYK